MRHSCDYQDQNLPTNPSKRQLRKQKKVQREKYNGKLQHNIFCTEILCNNREKKNLGALINIIFI